MRRAPHTRSRVRPAAGRGSSAACCSTLGCTGTAHSGNQSSEPDSDADFISRGENFTASESSTLFSTEASPVEFRSLSQYQPEPSSHSYRVYVGVLVTLLLALLVYITWRGNTAFWSSATAPAALPRAVPTPSGEPQAGTPSKPTETATTQPSSANKRELTSAPAVSPPQNQKQTNESAENNPRIKARPHPVLFR